jgi:fatty acid desaturase
MNILLDHDKKRNISELNSFYSLFAILEEWALIFLAIFLHLKFHNPLVYALVAVFIGTRMYALYAILHDGIHFLVMKKRRLNDIFSRLFLAWPLFASLGQIRKKHLAHHRHLCSDADPEYKQRQYAEFQFPQKGLHLSLIFIKDIVGLNFIHYKIKKAIHYFQKSEKEILRNVPQENYQLIFYIIFILIFSYLGWWTYFLIYWLFPYMTIYQALNRLRLVTEHTHLNPNSIFQSRTMNISLIERFFLSPHNLGYHTEHHLFPNVPFYRLQSLHNLLISDIRYRKNALIDNSYFSVIKKYVQ